MVVWGKTVRQTRCRYLRADRWSREASLVAGGPGADFIDERVRSRFCATRRSVCVDGQNREPDGSWASRRGLPDRGWLVVRNRRGERPPGPSLGSMSGAGGVPGTWYDGGSAYSSTRVRVFPRLDY